MHLFRSVFIVSVAVLAFMAAEAPKASAFILPMTRYMLDAIPDGAEMPDEEGAVTPDGAATVGVPSTDTDIPVAADTPDVADSQAEGAEAQDTPAPSPDTPAVSSASFDAASSSSSVVADVASSVLPAIPSAATPEKVLAQNNAASSVMGFGGSTILLGTVLSTIVYII
ncbi:hypothetical protein C8Q77DRAFT_1153284 [Trametes polyzona]|nr:hypothetical protein C8Q77DRAFT_1153284 [Trametes polyzona]